MSRVQFGELVLCRGNRGLPVRPRALGFVGNPAGVAAGGELAKGLGVAYVAFPERYVNVEAAVDFESVALVVGQAAHVLDVDIEDAGAELGDVVRADRLGGGMQVAGVQGGAEVGMIDSVDQAAGGRGAGGEALGVDLDGDAHAGVGGEGGGLAIPGGGGREVIVVVDRQAVGTAPEPEQAGAKDVGSLKGTADAIQFDFCWCAGVGLRAAEAGGEPDDLEASVGEDSGARARGGRRLIEIEVRGAAHEGDAGVANVAGNRRHTVQGVAAKHQGVKRRSHGRVSWPHARQG